MSETRRRTMLRHVEPTCFDVNALNRCNVGRPTRTGTVWAASAYIIVSGILCLACVVALFGWVAATAVVPLIYFETGNRKYTSIISVKAPQRFVCFDYRCLYEHEVKVSSNLYMIAAFGFTQTVFSQFPHFGWISDLISWVSFLVALMPIPHVFSIFGAGRVLGEVGDTLFGFVGKPGVTETQNTWRSIPAGLAIAYACSHFLIIILLTLGTTNSPRPESMSVKTATTITVVVTTIFSFVFGRAASSALSPGKLLDVTNAANVIYLTRAYQIFCQPLFASVEETALDRFPGNNFITGDITLFSIKLSTLRLVWRSIFVITITLISMLVPFVNDVVAIFGPFGFWPLTVYFPVMMYIVENKIPNWSAKWKFLQFLSGACLFISVAAAVGYFAGVDYAYIYTV